MKKTLLLPWAAVLMCWGIISAETPAISRDDTSVKISNKGQQPLQTVVSTKTNEQVKKALPEEKLKSTKREAASGQNARGATIISSDGRTAQEFLAKKKLLKEKAVSELPREGAKYNGPATMPHLYTPPSITDIILTEGFENHGHIPAGWDDCCDHRNKWAYNGGNPDFGPPTPHSGQYAAFFDVYNYAWGTTDTLISASMDLSSHSGSYAVSFWYFDAVDPEGIQDSVTLLVCEGGVNTYLGKLPQSVPVWTQFAYFFNSTSSEVTIKFAGFSCWGYTDPYIDDFQVADFVNMGRCCYGDSLNPSCTDNTLEECDGLGGTWTYGVTCTANPCPAVIIGDVCSAPFQITSFPCTDTRNTADFNDDYNDWPGRDVVYRFTLTEPMLMNFSLCNTEVPFDTWMSIWTEGNCGSDNVLLASNDDTCSASPLLSVISNVVLGAGTYYILVEPSFDSGADGTYTLDVTAEPAAPVIDFQVTAPGQWTANTCGAGDDCGLHASEDEVWEVTIPYDATWLFALCNSPIVWDTYMSLGSSYCTVDIAGNDDGCGGDTYYLSRITAPLIAGVYYVTVEGLYSGGCGPYTLDIVEAPAPPPNDNCADVNPADYPLSDGVPVVYTGNNSNATMDCPTNGLAEVWIPFSTSECMDVTINFCGTAPSPFWANITMYNECPCGVVIWDNAENWTECGDGNWTLHFYNLPAGNYYYPLNADLMWDPTGPYTLTVTGTVCPPPPANDNCADATPIGDVQGLPFSTRNAYFDGNGTCMFWSNIWYKYTASCDGFGFFSLCGSRYDTEIAVYDGATCDPLPLELGCNDEACGSQSQITVPVTAGHQYLIEVGGYDTYAGDGYLTTACLPPPPNDNCVDVNPADFPLSDGVPQVYQGNNAGATNDCYQLDWAQVWIPFSTDTCMDVTISSCGTGPILTQVGIVLYSDCPCGDFTIITDYNGDECGDGNWTAHINGLPPGNYYYPLYSAELQGPYTITVTGVVCRPPPPDPCENAYYNNGPFDRISSISSDRQSDSNFETWAADDVVLSEEITIAAINWYAVTDSVYDFRSTADIAIMGDGGGMPGTPLLELADVSATRTATNQYYSGAPVYYYTISRLNFTLGPGTFWFALRSVNWGLEGQTFWMTAPLTGSECYFKSAYFGYPDWVPGSTVFEVQANLSFCFSVQGAGCGFVVGDFNGSGTWNGQDVGALLNYFKGWPVPDQCVRCLPCSTMGLNMYYPAGEVNGSCSVNGNDITWMVNHFKYWRAPDWPYPGTPCPQCLPADLNPPATTVEPTVSPILKAKATLKTGK